MATKTTIRHLDDLERTKGRDVEADRPDTQFEIDGKAYAIDLSDENYRLLCESLAPFLAAARRASTGARRSSVSMPSQRSTTAGDREQNQAIREWAVKRGMTIADRGRIPAEVLEAYHARSTEPRNGHAVLATPAPAPEPAPEPVEATVAAPEPAEEPAAPPAKSKGNIARIAARVAAEAAAQAEPEPLTFKSKGEMNKAVREWAAGKGVPLAPRGKVPGDVMDQYVRVHGEPVIG